MTFGETLQALLSISGLKSRHLALTLGYDVSYISRWINGVKLPSTKNNDRLFQDIAAFFVSNSEESVRAQMIERLRLPCEDPGDDEALTQAVLRLLQNAYTRQAGTKSRPNGLAQQNAAFLPGESIQGNAVLWETLAALPAEADCAEIITTAPICQHYRRNDQFFQNLTRAVRRPVRIWQFLCLEDVRAHPNESFRSLLYLLSVPGQVEYLFYELKAPQTGSSLFLIRDGLLQLQAASPFSDEDFFVLTQDPAILRRYWSIAFRLVDNQKPLVRPDRDWARMKGRFGVNFLMQQRLRCILKNVSADFFAAQAGDPGAPPEADGKSDRHRQVMSMFDTILLYKEAVIEYTMEARRGGAHAAVSREQRSKTLQFFIDQALCGSRRLLILDAANSGCSYDDLCASVCIGSHHACVVTHPPGHKEQAFTISNRELVAAMNLWFDNLEALPQDQYLAGQDAAAYLARCMRLL